MLKNNYLTFGNSIMQKYSGMISRINPLSLIFLQNEEEEEQQPVKAAPITNVRNYFYRTNNYMYSNVVQRYIHNYNQMLSVVQSNTLYANSPNFKMDVHPVQLNHTSVQTTEDLETVVKQTTEHLLKEYVQIDRIQEKTAEKVMKQLTEGMSAESLKVLPGKVREKVFTEITNKVQEKILPIVLKEKESSVLTKETNRLVEQSVKEQENTVLTKEITGQLEQSIKTVIEQNAGRLPKQVVTEITAKMTQEMSVRLTESLQNIFVKQQTEKRIEKQETNQKEIINRILIKQIEPYIMAMSPGTSRSVIRQEIQKVCQKEEATQILVEELEHFSNVTERKNDTVVIRESIQSLIQKIIEHTDTCRKGKEKYERQVVSRLVPLPIRPVSLEYRKEKEESEDVLEGQSSGKQEKDNRVLQQKVVQIMKKEQTAESKYYTHFIEKFLKQVKEQNSVEEVDRSTLPAGIIYHQKPKETVRFVNKDIIKLPMEMLQQQTGQQLQDKLTNEVANIVKNELTNSTKNEIVNQLINSTKNEIVSQITNNIRNDIASEIVNKATNEVVNHIEINTTGVSEYVDRRVIRRKVPEFTIQQSVIGTEPIRLYSTGNTMKQHTGALELTLLIQDSQEPVSGLTNRVESMPSQGSTRIPQSTPINGGMAVSSKQGVSPMALVYKREESRREENDSNRNSTQQSNTEFFNQEQDIVFTKNIVKQQNISTDITESVYHQQEVIASGQMPGAVTAGKPSAPMAGQTVGQTVGANVPTGMIPAAKVERMISESVSKHMDENINEISRQVYRTLERQIKKEQERRGL